jgi:hypothetical protein
MWRIMIGVVHLHNNTEEAAVLRHADSFPTVTDLTGSALRGELREFFEIRNVLFSTILQLGNGTSHSAIAYRDGATSWVR